MANDGFSANLLSNLTDASMEMAVHSASNLSSGDVIAVGVLTLPPNVLKHPHIANDHDLNALDRPTQQRTSSVLLRMAADGTLLWAVRNVLCLDTAHFYVVVDEPADHIFIVGSTTGAYNDTATNTKDTDTDTNLQNTTQINHSVHAGAVIMKYTLSGDRVVTSVQDVVGSAYFAVSEVPIDSSVVLAIGHCPESSPVFTALDGAPSKGGICGTLLRKADLSVVMHRGLSRADEREPGIKVESDSFWDMCTSLDGHTVFVATKRLVVSSDGIKSVRFIVLAADTQTLLEVAPARTVPDELQLRVRLAAVPGGDLVTAYVARTQNREEIIALRLTRKLNDSTWENTGSAEWRREIERDPRYSRSVATTMNAACTSIKDGVVALTVYTAEIIDRSVSNADKLAALNNARVAVIELGTSGNVGWIAQTWRTDWWEPLFCSSVSTREGSEGWMIAGIDRGITGRDDFGVDKGLLTVAQRPTWSSTPTPTPLSLSPVPNMMRSPAATPTPSGPECIGASSRLSGHSIGDVIASDGRLRLQWHPLRHAHRAGASAKRWVARMTGYSSSSKTDDDDGDHLSDMLCVEWDESKSRLCATKFHVVRVRGRPMYMRDACKRLLCTPTRDIPINYKGRCGDDIIMRQELSVTMHTGRAAVPASQAVQKECDWQRWSPSLWWLSTL